MFSGNYNYYGSSFVDPRLEQAPRASFEMGERYSRDILNPSLQDRDYLARHYRKKIIGTWLAELRSEHLHVLDVGGRVQPWRPLLGERIEQYVGLDPILEGMVDVVAVGENIPFEDGGFDLVICTQMLTYASNPMQLVSELYRVLRPGGTLLLSTTAMHPKFHDERWRFLPGGLRILLSDFSKVEIVPEGYSIVSFARFINVALALVSDNYYVQRALSLTLIPLINRIAPMLDRFSGGSTHYTSHYSVRAIR